MFGDLFVFGSCYTLHESAFQGDKLMDVSWVMTTETDIKQCKELLSHFIEAIIQETIKSASFLMESQWFREEIIHSTNKQ